MNDDRPESFKAEINAIPHSFSKITWGTTNLKKIEKVYSTFQIPSSESIVAYIKSSIPFMGPSIVITDRALYSYLHEAFPISEICRYVVSQADEKAAVTLSTAGETQNFLGSTLVAKNIAGAELVQLIRNLQQELLKKYTWAKQLRDAIASELLAAAQGEMKTGRILEKYISLLDALALEKSYCDAITMLKAEDVFRTCSVLEYQNFLNCLPSLVTSDTRTVLHHSQEKFTQSLLQDLEDLSLNFNRDFLSQIYSNMSQLTTLSDAQCLILAYVCARLDKKEPFTTIREQVRRRLGNARAQSLDFFRGCYYNARMQKVYETIRSGTMPPSEWLEWTDSVGLSALHYAIILRQEKLVEQMLEQKSWKAPSPVSDDEAMLLYDYTVLACYTGLSNRNLVFQKTSGIVAAQLRSCKALEQRLWLKKRKLDIQNAAVQKAKVMVRQAQQNSMPDEAFEYREKLEVLQKRRAETIQEIDEIRQAILDIEYEIQELTEDAMISAMDTIHRLKESNHPLIKYLFCLFSDPGLLYRVTSAGQNRFRLYQYHGFAFVTLSEIHIDLPYFEEDSKREESYSHTEHKADNDSNKEKQRASTEEPIIKPYGTSWFSPQAHCDMKKLKEEYRILAKKYHPDVCRHIRSQQIFQEISNERADILESMKE